MDDSSIDLIVTDPPYFKVKADWWDRQWEKPEAFLSWIGELCDEWRRVLKPNGSLYVFASPQMSHAVETEVRKRFNVLTNIRWRKPEFSTKAEMFDKDDLRAPFPASETIIFAEQASQNGSVVGARITEARIAAGLTCDAIERRLGYLDNKGRGSRLCYRWETGSSLPTEDDFCSALQACGVGVNANEYEDLRREYETLRRPFNASDKRPYTDVWDYATVSDYPGKHPCEKPLAMMEHIVETSSKPGALVLDCFAGSGVVGEACRNFGRRAILCEIDQRWYRKITSRIGQRTLFAG